MPVKKRFVILTNVTVPIPCIVKLVTMTPTMMRGVQRKFSVRHKLITLLDLNTIIVMRVWILTVTIITTIRVVIDMRVTESLSLPRGDFVIYDLEVYAAPTPRNFDDIIPDITYADWEDYPSLGFSVLCAYDGRVGDFLTYFSDDVDGLAPFVALAADTTVLGFNTIAFDDKVLAALGHRVVTDFDLLEHVRLASGQPATYVRGVSRGGYSLDALCLASFEVGKSGHGALAPIWWQQGYRSRVVNYCLRDVRLTAALLSKWAFYGFLPDPSFPLSQLKLSAAGADFRHWLAVEVHAYD